MELRLFLCQALSSAPRCRPEATWHCLASAPPAPSHFATARRVHRAPIAPWSKYVYLPTWAAATVAVIRQVRRCRLRVNQRCRVLHRVRPVATSYRCRQLASMVRHGELVRVEEVARILEEMAKIKDESGWQAARPTDGKWYLSHRPDRRGNAKSVMKVKVVGDTVKFPDGSMISMSHSQFIGAFWHRRENPADPFEKELS